MEEIQKVDTIVVNGVDIPLGGQGGGSGKILHKWKIGSDGQTDYSEDENNFADVVEDMTNVINHDIVVDLSLAGISGVYCTMMVGCMEQDGQIVITAYLALQSPMLIMLNTDGSIASVQIRD